MKRLIFIFHFTFFVFHFSFGQQMGWTDISSNIPDFPGDMSQIYFLDHQHGWAIQFFGKIFTTDNGGNSWNEQSPGISDETLTNIQMTSLYNGYICGNNRTLLKYTQISGEEEQGGMEAWGLGGVEVWPNPTRGVVSLRSAVGSQRPVLSPEEQDEGSAVVEILDLNGKTLELWNSELWNFGTRPHQLPFRSLLSQDKYR